MIRAVVDTNVLVSGLLSPGGKEALIVLAIHRDLIRACLSSAIILEYRAVLARPKFSFAPDEIEALLGMFRDKGELLDPLPSLVASPDPGDTKFLSCALAARADFIITGNKRHFPAAPYGRTHVVNARAARSDHSRHVTVRVGMLLPPCPHTAVSSYSSASGTGAPRAPLGISPWPMMSRTSQASPSRCQTVTARRVLSTSHSSMRLASWR